jgi:hypothetical protein
MGYIPEDGPNLLCNRFDADPETFVLLVTDAHGCDVATMTLVFDSAENGLPLDDIFQADADRFRARGKRLAEIVRLAVDPSGRSGREVLIHLFNFAYVYAKHVKGYDGFLVTVNPRHAPFYERSWGFKVYGEEKPCPKVQNAPAILLHLCFAYVSERALREAGRPVKPGEKATFYTHAYPTEAEPFIAAFLRNRHNPMTQDEATRLGLVSATTSTRYAMLD